MDFSRNIRIIKQDIQLQRAECLVNAANEQLKAGSGVCGALFAAAGVEEMTAACNAIGFCPTGQAVVTPAFGLQAEYVIHAVGPRLSETGPAGLPLLRSAYLSAMEQIHRLGCHKAVFPLLSAGSFRSKAITDVELWETAIYAVRDYMAANPAHRFEIIFCCRGSDTFSIGARVLCMPAPITPLPPTVLQPAETGHPAASVETANAGKKDFVFFWKLGEANECFTQWYPAPITIEGIRYENAEQYMMAKKALLFGDIEHYYLILHTADPKQCKAYGKAVRGFDSAVWQSCNEEIVFNANFAKFTQHPALAQKLLQTGDRILAEASPLDTNYGIGLKADDPDASCPEKWPGKNLLGKILMDIRDLLNAAQG